jgi:ATP-dependent DNA ligase
METRRKTPAVMAPIAPMLAKVADEIPPEGEFLYEPKWDGFRAMVFRGEDVFIQSRDLRPFDRYFPDLHEAFLAQLPEGCVVDGEIVVVTPEGLDFDALQMRLHPAASQVEKLARETPASFVAFDVLAVEDRDLRRRPQAERRRELESLLARVKPPIYLTPVTTDRSIAQKWLKRFEGAGLDGVIAKESTPCRPIGKEPGSERLFRRLAFQRVRLVPRAARFPEGYQDWSVRLDAIATSTPRWAPPC